MKLDADTYKLSEKEKQDFFEFVKKQMKKATCYKDAPAFEYLLQCRERVRLGLFAEKKSVKFTLKL